MTYIPKFAVLKIGDFLENPFYFNPPTSLWVIAFWRGRKYKFERENIGAKWKRVEKLSHQFTQFDY